MGNKKPEQTKEELEMKDSVDTSLQNTNTVVEEDALANIPNQTVSVSELYGESMMNAGTEEITSEDLNIPTLKLVQDNTKDLENKHVGWFCRSDTQEQMETVDVNLISVTTKVQENYKKDAMETVKIYFGYYAGTKEPFRMYLRGTSMQSHRMLQSEVLMYKNRYKIPMFALTVKLTSVQEKGNTKENVPYDIRKYLFEIVKVPGDKSKPIVETNVDRVAFLYESVSKFKKVAEVIEEEGEPLPFS